VRDAIGKAIALKNAMTDSQRQINERNQQIVAITGEQNRIRENMRTVNDRQSQYYNRLLTKLNEQESQIEKLQTERDELQKKLDQQRKELEDYLANMNVG
jgi:chromosome segregation ATPase